MLHNNCQLNGLISVGQFYLRMCVRGEISAELEQMYPSFYVKVIYEAISG